MNKQKSRKYVSPARKRQAKETRSRIIAAAEGLMHSKGFPGMTVAEVASVAGVSQQTVYAIFSSKAGIINAAFEERIISDGRNVEAIKNMQLAEEPLAILSGLARIARTIFENNTCSLSAVYGAGAVSPKLADLENDLDKLRLKRLEEVAQKLKATGVVQEHLSITTIQDYLSAMLSREMVHVLTVRRGWSYDKYEKELLRILASSLLKPEAISPALFAKD